MSTARWPPTPTRKRASPRWSSVSFSIKGVCLMTDLARSDPIIEILDDSAAVCRRVADWLAGEAAQTEGRFAIALSGGSTPKQMYELLAQPPARDAVPWQRVHLF